MQCQSGYHAGGLKGVRISCRFRESTVALQGGGKYNGRVRWLVFLWFAAWLIAADPAAVERALAYLSQEVPKWPVENGCFSCHNNGDAARALYTAGRLQPLASTTAWLRKTEDWDKGRSNSPGSDKTLARYQFSVALSAAAASGAIKDEELLGRVAANLVRLQQPDGAWRVEDDGEAPGSPVTWGTPLATHLSRDFLTRVGGHDEAIRRSGEWLLRLRPRYLIDEAAVLLAFPRDPVIRQRAASRFATAQTSDGGWGPRANAPAEVFDTAVVLLALDASGEATMIRRGREFLIRNQQPSGGWTETTRPSGSASYAQHVSTTAWATLALLGTDANRN